MRKRKFPIRVMVLLAFMVSTARADTLSIPGSGVCEFLLHELAAGYNARHPGRQVIIPPSVGSKGGIRLVGSGEAVLGRVASNMKDNAKAYGLTYLPFARDAVVFAVGANVTVDNLSTEQIVGIYQGRITNWQEVGGRPGVIRVLVRQPGDSVLLQIGRRIPEFQTMTFPADSKMVHYGPEMGKMLGKYKLAIGMGAKSSLLNPELLIKPLGLDGIRPDPENMLNGKYPMLEDFALIFKENRLTPLARDFMDFIFSSSGQETMHKYGVIPLKK
ncbi:MAG: hypothetical protein FJ134_11220 [Deltaproteobacteria bacterium]|nr:hypothetical protein [Deltaproteobacteria bacterium]